MKSSGRKRRKRVSAKRRIGETERRHPDTPTPRHAPLKSYDSIASAAASLDIPAATLRKCKRDGAPGFRGSRVYPMELLPWLAKSGVGRVPSPGGLADKDTLERLRLKGKIEHEKFLHDRERKLYLHVHTAARDLMALGERLKLTLRVELEDNMPPQQAGLTAPALRVMNKALNDRLCSMFHEDAGKILGPRSGST